MCVRSTLQTSAENGDRSRSLYGQRVDLRSMGSRKEMSAADPVLGGAKLPPPLPKSVGIEALQRLIGVWPEKDIWGS